MKPFFTLGKELRPCIDKKSGERLLFHRWVYDDVALCEKEDGTIELRGFSVIKFLDSKHKEFDFTDHPTEKGGVE